MSDIAKLDRHEILGIPAYITKLERGVSTNTKTTDNSMDTDVPVSQQASGSQPSSTT
jgi:hypothetical protein